MAALPYMKLYVADYLHDTLGLSVAESGAYLHLLMAAWNTADGRLPDDNIRLARFARCSPKQWARIRETVLSFWELENGWWTNKRLLTEHQRATRYSQSRSANRRAKSLNSKDADATYDDTHDDTYVDKRARVKTHSLKEKGLPNGNCQQVPPADPLPVQKAFENWNKIAEANGLPKATKLTEARRRQIKARLREFGIEGWNEALWKIEGNSFFHGRNDRGWVASLDFLIRPSKFAKVLEGGYDTLGGTDA